MDTKKANSGFLMKEKYDDLLQKENNSKNRSSQKNQKIIKE